MSIAGRYVHGPRSSGAQCVWHFQALVGLGKGFVGNADLRSLHKLTSTNPKEQLATCIMLGGYLSED